MAKQAKDAGSAAVAVTGHICWRGVGHHFVHEFFVKVARLTGLEPATPGVTGRYSNQLSYNRA